MATAWAAEAARQIAEQPIFMTWNFFLTLILVPSVGWFITRSIKTSDELKEKLFRNSIDNLEKAITDWQAGAKERTAALCKKIDDLAMRKVENHECEKTHKTIDKVIDELKNRVYPA